jgi:AcrR family transcriptional regulator
MPANNWLALRRTEVAAERILDAAGKLFTERDPGSIGMNEIACAAGCSRATLYRYFESREALRNAYVHREAYRVHDEIKKQLTGISDSRQRLIAGVTTTLRLVRESPALSSWFATKQAPIGGEVAEHSEVINALAAGFLISLGSEEPGAIERRARWLVRIITSLLLFPGHDGADEAAMIEEFAVPVLVSAGQVSAPG